MSSTVNSSEEAQKPQQEYELSAETVMNLTLMDPPRWGWTAVGGVADLLTPQEVRQE